ncbi:MAG: TetR/AcrR family transcriptional regulator [Cyanobacteria bacterium J06598_3]
MGAVTAAAIQAKKEQILKGALQVFLHDGYEGTSMDRVAEKAGVSKITIYKHFLDKKSLFTILIKSFIAGRFSLALEALPLDESPNVVLRQLATDVLALFLDDQSVAFYRLMVGESRRFPELSQLFLRTVSQQVWSVLSVYLAACPQVQCENPGAIAHIFVDSLMGHVLTHKVMGEDPVGRERLSVDTVTDDSFIIAGLIDLIVP